MNGISDSNPIKKQSNHEPYTHATSRSPRHGRNVKVNLNETYTDLRCLARTGAPSGRSLSHGHGNCRLASGLCGLCRARSSVFAARPAKHKVASRPNRITTTTARHTHRIIITFYKVSQPQTQAPLKDMLRRSSAWRCDHMCAATHGATAATVRRPCGGGPLEAERARPSP